MHRAKRQVRGLLHVYGSRLPQAGAVFLTPVHRGMLTKVDKALRVCAERWPATARSSKYDGLWASGEFSQCDEDADRKFALGTPSWNGCRYEWDFDTKAFKIIKNLEDSQP